MGSATNTSGRATEITAVFTLRVNREQIQRLREIAALEHRTASQKLRQMIDLEIAAHDSDEPVAA